MYYNVLPEEVKKLLKKEYRLRFFSVLIISISSVVIFMSVVMFSLLVLVFSENKNILGELESIKDSSLENGGAEILSELKFTKEKIAVLKQGDEKNQPSELIEKILSSKPSGARIDSIVYEQKDGAKSFLVSGRGDDRASIISFQDALEETSPFKKVDLPVGIFARNTNIPYTLTITGNF